MDVDNGRYGTLPQRGGRPNGSRDVSPENEDSELRAMSDRPGTSCLQGNARHYGLDVNVKKTPKPPEN